MKIPKDAVVVVFGPNGATIRGLVNMFDEYVFPNFFNGKSAFFFLDYPCSGMSHSALKNGSDETIRAALQIYSHANKQKGNRQVWVITMSIGMAVFSSILPFLEKDEQPDVIFCMNGLMSMRKTVLKILPVARVYYYGLGKDYNTARLISEHLDPRVKLFWVQNKDDEMIDIPNLKKSVARWKKEKKLDVRVLDRESYYKNKHNDFNLYDGLQMMSSFI